MAIWQRKTTRGEKRKLRAKRDDFSLFSQFFFGKRLRGECDGTPEGRAVGRVGVAASQQNLKLMRLQRAERRIGRGPVREP